MLELEQHLVRVRVGLGVVVGVGLGLGVGVGVRYRVRAAGSTAKSTPPRTARPARSSATESNSSPTIMPGEGEGEG